jgi:hypothetical protein
MVVSVNWPGVPPTMHPAPMASGAMVLSRNTKRARAKYMSFEELCPTSGWNQRSASAPDRARSQYGCAVAASA